jgi:GNAT superfamily N-acetyltransferase
MKIVIRELYGLEEMLSTCDILKEVYITLNLEDYRTMLEDMLPHNYGQIAAFDDDKLVAVAGYWLHTKIWSGKYLEMDNVVVAAAHRSFGIGKMMEEYLAQKAKENHCKMMVLDAFVENFKAHKFYMNQGYVARGNHFVKNLD